MPRQLSRVLELYASLTAKPEPQALRELIKADLFATLVIGCRRLDLRNQWLLDRCDEVNRDPDGRLDLWARGHGKAIDVEEPVLTTDGWRRHGELTPGDYVYGPDGEPALVVGKTGVFDSAQCYRVTFCDGYEVVASAEHLWSVRLPDRSRVNGTNERRKWKGAVLTTEALVEHVEAAKRYPSRRYPAVAVAQPLRMPAQSLPIDPYVLGCWLGDGTSTAASITTSKEDFPHFKAEMERAGHRVDVQYERDNCLCYGLDKRDTARVCIRGHLKEGDNAYYPPGSDVAHCRECRRIERRSRLYGDAREERTASLGQLLRDLGLMVSGTRIKKRIPQTYLCGSIEQRMALLQGLMDTDGCCSKACGQAVFAAANHELATDVLELAQSLGLKATIGQRHVTYKGEARPFWHVQFLADRQSPPFRLPRKVERCVDRQMPAERKIKRIDPVPSRPVSCIQVDREDGCYLVGKNLVPTHNSSIITLGKTIQDILSDPETTIGIFSHTRPIAKGFFRAIKREFEANTLLRELFSDVLWENPRKEAPKWSEDDGLIVKRRGNPKEATLEAWGLIDGQPVGKHFAKLVFDDIVTAENAASPEMREKTLRAVELAFNLGTRKAPRRMIGTRYHYQDAYKELIDRGAVVPRVYPAVGEDGRPVLLSDEELDDIRRDQGPFAFASQYMLEPKHGSTVGFRLEWWRTWRGTVTGNRYLVVDPANSKKRSSDYTAAWVVTAGYDGNWYVEHIRRDRLGLTERVDMVMELHREYQPKAVGYEQYGLQADIEAIEDRQSREGYRFTITPLAGKLAKFDRIMRLVPLFEQGKVWLPDRCTVVTSEEGMVDMVQTFRDKEFMAWPFSAHDDMLDALARITDTDLNVIWPKQANTGPRYRSARASDGNGALAAL